MCGPARLTAGGLVPVHGSRLNPPRVARPLAPDASPAGGQRIAGGRVIEVRFPRPCVIAHQPAAALWGTGGLVWLLVTAAAYLAAGILAFRLGERTASTRITLARDGAPEHSPRDGHARGT
jgi:hypothetical protein